MSNSIKVVVAVLVVALLGAGGYYAVRQTAPASTAQTNNPPAESAQTDTSDTSKNDTETVAATITYTDSGFSPSLTTVKSGDTIKVTNNSSSTLEMDSNPHPVHTDNRELNVGMIAPGKSDTFVLTTKGTWGFHNHLDPDNTARVDVE